jgi:hypothetical protein
VPTRLPGVTFGGTFPRLAGLADRLAVVRSFATGDGNHDLKPLVGRDTFGANLGAHFAQVAGATHPETSLPTNALLFPRAVDPSTQPGTAAFGNFAAAGALGAGNAPFVVGGGGDLQDDMRLKVPLDRLEERRRLLAGLDEANRSLDAAARAGFDGARARAFRLILQGAGDAFDLSKEPAKVVARYDTAPLVRPEAIDKKWKNYHNYVDNARALGKLLLLARRLVERGAGFVTVTTNFVWDMHADVNNAPCAEGMRYMGLPFDHAVSAFIEDVEARGLSERVLLVCCGEMGRTPKVNKGGGRDHWGGLAPLLLYGGGLRTGQVIGQSDRSGGSPASAPVTNRHLIASVLHTLFDVPRLRLQAGLSRELAQMVGWDPIPNLHG